MCVPHGMTRKQNRSYIQRERVKKVRKMVSKDIFKHGDPDFIDERVKSYTKR